MNSAPELMNRQEMQSSIRNLVLTLLLAAAPLRPDVVDASGPNGDGFARKAWTIDEGLPQNTITALVQTRDDYLWLGTFGGLARFDGLRFKIFDVANTAELVSNRILSLHEDSQGKLWIGTTDGGVCAYADGVFTRYTEQDGAPGGDIWSIAEDLEGTVWVGGGGLASYRDGEFETRRPVAAVNVSVTDIFVDGEKVWFATSHGLPRP